MADEPTRQAKTSNEVDSNSTQSNRGSGSSDTANADTSNDTYAGDDADEVEELEQNRRLSMDENDEFQEEEEEAEIVDEVVEKKDSQEKPKPKNAAKKVMEYDLWDMYPEMNLLAKDTKKEWNYNDAEVIRAIWLESKTNALREWKYRHTKIATKKKPTIPVQMNHAVQLRYEHREQLQEREKEEQQRNLVMTDIGRDAPDFHELQLPTTLTAQMRYNFNRDNPPVPKIYLRHFEKYRKPPFKTLINLNYRCRP